MGYLDNVTQDDLDNNTDPEWTQKTMEEFQIMNLEERDNFCVMELTVMTGHNKNKKMTKFLSDMNKKFSINFLKAFFKDDDIKTGKFKQSFTKCIGKTFQAVVHPYVSRKTGARQYDLLNLKNLGAKANGPQMDMAKEMPSVDEKPIAAVQQQAPPIQPKI